MFIYDINRREIKKYNVFDHYRFDREVDELLHKTNLSKEEFQDKLRSALMYYFWSKAEYEVAEEEGRLLFLPCNPGITLYVLRKKYTRCSKHNEEFDESICCGCEDECDSRLFYYILPCPDATAEQILEYERRGALNKTVFFNVEKAEKKLEELNGV